VTSPAVGLPLRPAGPRPPGARSLGLALALAAALAPLLRPAAAASAADAAAADAAPAGAKIQDTRRDLVKLRHEKRRKQQEKNQLDRREKDEVGKLDQLNRELAAARRDVLTHSRNLSLVQDSLQQVRSKLEGLQSEEDGDRAFLKADLVDLYKADTRQGPMLLFTARTPAELGIRARYLAALGTATLRRVDALRESIRQVDTYRREYDSKQVELQREVAEVETDRHRKERVRLLREAQLREVRSRKALAAAEVEHLQRQMESLQGMLDGFVRDEQQREAEEREEARQRAAERRQALAERKEKAPERAREAPRTWARTASSIHGRLPWPVVGRVLSRYGKQMNKELGTLVFNHGIEISAEEGSTVRAVAGGMVAFAGEMDGFGQLVVLDHGGSMLSVYGFGSQLRVQKGQAVEQGSVLEDVGEDPNSPGQAKLYFEIRQGVKAQDPLRYLARP